ncbi:MAG: hypothetical protein Q6364_00890 [Candidatus Hermodarchaeota archaeon]|nr:hypothetical protein [Candidatus Hermodarchaeota archaeon]
MHWCVNRPGKSIPGQKPKSINQNDALKELERIPPGTGTDYFIGFINEKEETIQFLRYAPDNWLIDIPILENGRMTHSHQKELKYSEVKQVVTDFFKGASQRIFGQLFEIK